MCIIIQINLFHEYILVQFKSSLTILSNLSRNDEEWKKVTFSNISFFLFSSTLFQDFPMLSHKVNVWHLITMNIFWISNFSMGILNCRMFWREAEACGNVKIKYLVHFR
jgi:hypothetical protein